MSSKDNIDGFAGEDLILGRDGDDCLEGWSGNDIIDGGSDRDYLRGGAGDDLLFGAAGDDLLFGNAGADIFELIPNFGTDTIADFHIESDFLMLSSGLSFEDLSFDDNQISLTATDETLAICRE